jgi:hypothetical protein
MNIDKLTIVNIMLNGARKCADQSNYSVAIGLFERALCELERTYEPSSMKLAPVLDEMGECYEKLGLDVKARECRTRLSSLLRLMSKSA